MIPGPDICFRHFRLAFVKAKRHDKYNTSCEFSSAANSSLWASRHSQVLSFTSPAESCAGGGRGPPAAAAGPPGPGSGSKPGGPRSGHGTGRAGGGRKSFPAGDGLVGLGRGRPGRDQPGRAGPDRSGLIGVGDEGEQAERDLAVARVAWRERQQREGEREREREIDREIEGEKE